MNCLLALMLSTMVTLRASSGEISSYYLLLWSDHPPLTLTLTLLTAQPLSAPQITLHPTNITGYTSTSLPCMAPGNPAPAITWFKDGAMLDVEGNPKLLQNTEGSLQVSGLQDVDGDMLEGSYHCTATNSLGTTRSTAATLTRTGISIG